jgi:hypothetical protein
MLEAALSVVSVHIAYLKSSGIEVRLLQRSVYRKHTSV